MSNIKYQAFLKTIEFGSLTKAAEYLNYTQPGISQMISSLEKEVGFSLLIRSKEKVLPTENAKLLIPLYRQIISQENYIKDTVDNINNIRTGNIRMAVYRSCMIDMVPLIMQAFSEKYPGITIHIEETTRDVAHKKLQNNYVDLAIMTDDIPPGFKFIPLFKDELKVIIPIDHPLCEKTSLTLSDIAEYPFLMPITDYDDHLKTLLKKEKFEPSVRFRIGCDEAFLSLVSKGVGIAILTDLVISSSIHPIASRSLNPNRFRQLGIVIRSRESTSPAVREFINIAEQTITPSTMRDSLNKTLMSFSVDHYDTIFTKE